MPSRRTFLQAAAVAITTNVGAKSALAQTEARHWEIGHAVVDCSAAPAKTFATSVARFGVPLERYEGDIAPTWFDGVKPRLRSGRVAFAGLTSQGALFCLERWCWDFDMRVVLRIEHLLKSDGRFHHIPSQEIASQTMASLSNAGGDFGEQAAAALLGGYHYWRQTANLAPPRVENQSEIALVSWVIAPRDALAALA